MVNERVPRKFSVPRKILTSAFAVLALPASVLIDTGKLPARSRQESAAQPKIEFEVSSVRRSKPEAPPRGNEFLTPFEAPAPRGGLFSANAPLLLYIIFAYKILDMGQLQSISLHLPAWAREERFEIQARAPQERPTKDQLRAMMRSLLADRFKLAIYTEIRQLPVYALVLDRPGSPGPQLKPHPKDEPCPDQADTTPPTTPGAAPAPYCGMAVWREKGLLHFRMLDVPLEEMAGMLGGAAGLIGGRDPRPIIDQTGLSGRFDVNIEFLKDPGGADLDSDAAGPTFTNALKNQLGMKLVKQTGPAKIFIVDHIEQPSEN